MARVVVSINTVGRRLNFRLPGQRIQFSTALSESISELPLRAINAFKREFTRQIRTVVVPELKKQTPRRTGRLRRSTKSRRLPQGVAIQGAFYGAYLNPSQRRLAQQIFNRHRTSIISSSVAAAKRAVQ